MVNEASQVVHLNNSAQSAVRGDPYSLGKAMKVLNKYEDLENKAYVKISKALQ